MPRRPRPSRQSAPDNARDGRVVADFGRHVLVEDDEQVTHPCTLRGRRLRAVCGDRVTWQAPVHGGRGTVESVLPRVSELTRPGSRGTAEVLAANFDQILVVCALAPPFDPNVIDRYLVAAELMDVDAAIVCNKVELAAASDMATTDELLAEYTAVGYRVVRVSARTGFGMPDLARLAADRVSILVGQSGVGKSTLLNSLRPQTDAAVGGLSSSSGEGTHTTSASRLYRLPTGGELIDSPGVREYTPHLREEDDPAAGYAEFREPARECRFRNCQHTREPDCGVKAAVAGGRISTRRYNSYLSLNADPG